MNSEGKKISIGRKTLISVIAFALVLTIAVSVPVSYGFSVLSKNHYYEDSLYYANLVADVIRGDDVQAYLDTGQKDEYYNNIEEFLVSVRDQIELTQITVFVPDEEDMAFIWDTNKGNGSFALGDRAGYDEEKPKAVIRGAFSEEDKADRAIIEHPELGRQLCTYAPVHNSKDEAVALVCITRPDIKVNSIISRFLLAISAVSALVSAVMMLIVYRMLKKNFIEPVDKLTESAETMVGSLDRKEALDIDIHTNDELQTLADAFMKMDVDLRAYIEELSDATAERERISGELDAAAKIQRGILPKRGTQYEVTEEFDLAASMKSAREVGGDFYDIFMADDRHLVLVIADVAGKGIPAALFMVATKILLKYGLKAGMSPAEALVSTNEKLIESNDMELFVTMWTAYIDLDTGESIVINAGHEHPAVKRKDGIFELVRYPHSPAVATFEDISFREREFKLDPGDSLFVYTDGVLEAVNRENKQFGEDRLVMALNKEREASPEELLDNVKNALSEFIEGAPQFDDITMMAFRYNGRGEK